MIYINCKKIQKKLSAVEKDIQNYIQKYNEQDFSAILKFDDRLEVSFHLSPLREAIFEWYEFLNDADVLEVGAEFGALTGILCRKNKSVTVVEESVDKAKCIEQRCNKYKNLTIYAGMLPAIKDKQKFDYIIISKTLETIGEGSQDPSIYINYLKKMKKLLKPQGKVLIMVNNKYGLKYFCGEKHPYAQRAFSGFNKYNEKRTGYCFDREELKNILNGASFKYLKFYYPMPDCYFTQVIYSEDYLPKDEIKERIMFYTNKNERIIDESCLYSDISRNKVFEFFSNSFFIECANHQNFFNADYAAITIDRQKEKQFITSIYKKNIVKKRAVQKEGIESLKILVDNIYKLKQRGIFVVDEKLQNDSVYMPYMKSMTLAQYLRTLKKDDKKIFFDVYDRLWENIVQSSDLTTDISLKFKDLLPDGEWGPILKKAYIEMIPMNCFYEKDKFIFFDQEFVLENYPAKFVMFRALAFIYPELQIEIELAEIQHRYGFNQVMWDVFWSVEAEFFYSLKNVSIYKQMHMKKIDSDDVVKNCKKFAIVDKFNYCTEKKKIRDKMLFEREDFFSFAIFDTLLTTTTATPKGIFLLMQKKLQNNQSFPMRIRNSFYDLRIYYEEEARRALKIHEEITLNEIYQLFSEIENINQSQKEYLIWLEENIELENVVILRKAVNRIKYLLGKEKKVVLISDTYRRKHAIRNMLKKVHPILENLPIYISSEYRKTKKTGELYKVVQERENVQISHWVHCGNNLLADRDAAESLGIATILEDKEILNPVEQEILQSKERDLDIQLAIGKNKIDFLGHKIYTSLNFDEEYMLEKINKGKKIIDTPFTIPLCVLKNKIIIYGAGVFGQKIYKVLSSNKNISIMGWIDQDYEEKQRAGFLVSPIEMINNICFDQIVIAIKNNDGIKEIKNNLIKMGVDKRKIIDRI